MSQKKILVVEDNPRNMRLIEVTLKARGYLILGARDGEKGLKTALAERPDLIIADIQLPKMDGLELIRRLKERPGFEHIPVIALTAYAMKGDKGRFLEAGCDAYLSKPIDTRELPRLVEEMLSPKE